MPLKLNVGLSRKVGEANYGSRGASVNIELELEAGAVGQPDRLHQQIRQAYELARRSVDEELGRDAEPGSNGGHRGALNGQNGTYPGGNGHSRGPSNGNGRRATDSQCRALRAIASRQRTDLSAILQERFGTGRPEDLSLQDASSLIDDLKAASPR